MLTETLQAQPPWLEATAPRLGRYVLGPLLGQGGMGEVREAWDSSLRRTVALKRVRALDPVSLIRFMHEGQLQARVIHPNVCRVYDVESTDGAPRITMQLVPGGRTLADLAPQLTVAELLDLFAQVADGVQAAHRQKLIHRDLKPSNILLEPRPEGGWTPYVCDFGLAMALEEPALTCSQGIKGTPAYMAPEQIRGERHLVGPATDVYALGGSLFFALYGQVPASCCLDVHALLGQRKGLLPLPRCPKQDLPRDLEHLVRRCLEPDPAGRYDSMGTLAEELRRIARGEPARTRPRLPRALRALGRGRLAAALACLAAAGFAAALGMIQHQRRALARAEQRAVLARRFALEADALEADLGMEKLLPVHDLRPAYARAGQRLAALQAQVAALGAEAEGPGRYALGRARFLLGDYAGARRELERAWAAGDRSPEAAEALAMARVADAFRTGAGGTWFQGGPGGPGGPDGPSQALTQGGPGGPAGPGQALPQGDPDGPGETWLRALQAMRRGDFAQAAAAAQASLVDHPWCNAAATLEGLSWLALGGQQALAGDAAGAERSFRRAMDAADRQLALARSDLGLHQVCLMAGRALACHQWPQGAPALATLDHLQRRAEDALRLAPDRPDLQEERLDLSLLKAACQAGRGRNPAAELASAQAFQAAWGRGPHPTCPTTGQALRQWAEAALRPPRPGSGAMNAPIGPGPERLGPATILF